MEDGFSKTTNGQQEEQRQQDGPMVSLDQDAYECCDMLEYLAKKYDIKGEIAVGEKGFE